MGSAVLNIAVLVAGDGQAGCAGRDSPSERDLSVAAGRALKLVGAEMLGVERTSALTCADQALMTPAELTARPW